MFRGLRYGSFGTALFVLIAWICPHAAAAPDDMVLMAVPINVAEAIIEPFWNPDLSGLPKWTVEPREECGLVVTQSWNAVCFEWTANSEQEPPLRMSREFNVDCSLCFTGP
ncbi:MAG: hypothetical protein K1Y02_20830 [Candidatus Hydrogenedentes bacterium]|nr:hypothetical protein [Candidatus Hydrogenedentota bacterium]